MRREDVLSRNRPLEQIDQTAAEGPVLSTPSPTTPSSTHRQRGTS